MRAFRAVALVAALLLTITATAESSSAAVSRVPNGRIAVGDSVMLGAKSHLQHRGFHVDASESRQVSSGVALLRSMKKHGSLRKQVVVHLGTNGTFTSSQCSAMRRTVGKHRNLFLVTVEVPRSWEAGNNKVIRHCASRYGNVRLIDWKGYVSHRSGLLYGDGVHLTPKGAKRYAALVDRNVDQYASR